MPSSAASVTRWHGDRRRRIGLGGPRPVRAAVTADAKRCAGPTIAQLLAGVAAAAITIGGLLHLAGADAAGHQVWRAAVALLAAELTFEVARTVMVDRHLGVDTIALVAMVGALALDEELAGVVIGLMFSGGAALEAVASRRARRELAAGRARAAGQRQHRLGARGGAVEAVAPGDVVLMERAR